jgi:hypothetical protein
MLHTLIFIAQWILKLLQPTVMNDTEVNRGEKKAVISPCIPFLIVP